MKLINLRLLQLAAAHLKELLLSIFLGVVAGALTIWQAGLLSQVIAGVFLGGQDLQSSALPLLGLLPLFLLKSGALLGAEIYAGRAARQVKSALRDRLYAQIQHLGPLYTRGERTGELVNTAIQGIEALDAYFSQYLPQLVLAALVPLTFLVFILPIEPLTGLILLLTAPLIPVFMSLIGNLAEDLTRRQWTTLSRMSAHFLDVLQGLETLKLFGRSRAQLAVIRQISEHFRERTLGVLRVAFLSALVLELVATLSTAVVAVEIGLRLLYGRLAFEQALFVLLLTPDFYLPLRLLGTRFHAGMAGVQAVQRIFAILDERPLTNPVEPQPAAAQPADIICAGLSYHYPDGRQALQQLDLRIEPGQHVALIGPSGAGKSTLVQLLLGFMSPTEGRLLGRPERIAWLPQEPYLFHDTLAANIRLGRPQASLEQVAAAARAAQVDEMIQSLPDGYQTVIGERAARLSGGQAQRIALARALLSDAPLVILDEPATHLDLQLQADFDAGIAQLLHGRTALIIAHRLQTAARADRVIVLQEGRIVQAGSPAELAHQPGLYQSWSAERLPVEILETAARPLLASAPIPQPASSSGEPAPAPLSLLLRFLTPFKAWIGLSVLLASLTIASSIGLLGTSAYIISAAALRPSIAVLQVAIVGVRFFGLSRGVLRYLERLVSHYTTFSVLARLRAWFYERLEPLAPARLQQMHSGDLLARIVADVDSLESFYVRAIAPPLTALVVALFAGGLLWPYAPQLTLVLWAFLALAGIWLPWWTARRAQSAGGESREVQAALSTALVDGIQGLPDLLAFEQAIAQQQRIAALDARLARYQARQTRIQAQTLAGMNLLTSLGLWSVLTLAIPPVVRGEIAGFYLASLALVALASFEAVQGLPQAAQTLTENLQAARRLYDVIAAAPAVLEPAHPHPVPPGRDLQIRGLSFSYPTAVAASDCLPVSGGSSPAVYQKTETRSVEASPLVLSELELDLPFGKHLALVGPSGAGKTSLLHLLLRFWDYETGQITLGGQELRSCAPEDIRRVMAVVSQRTHLFNASLRENLLIANPQASQVALEQAIETVELQACLQKLPDGYATLIGEHGYRLSGGERQRLSIARALLKDAPLLLLDEPTAGLDRATAEQVWQNLLTLMAGRSAILITHQLAGLDKLDEILVLQAGRVLERGRHADLLQSDGLYRRLWAYSQSSVDVR